MSAFPERIGLVETPFGLRPWNYDDDAGRPASAEYIRSDLVPHTAVQPGTVKVPESADEAAMMNLVSGEWLYRHAPERLTKSALAWYKRREAKP